MSSAYTLNKSLCVPLGGHGPPYPSFPQLFFPATPFGSVPFGICVVDGGILKDTQWSQVPTGASGSSEISTKLFVFLGTSLMVNGGETPEPSHVNSDGIAPLFLNSGL